MENKSASNNETNAQTTIAVYCGSGLGNNRVYLDAAHETGQSLAAAGMDIIYGGGGVGLIGDDKQKRQAIA